MATSMRTSVAGSGTVNINGSLYPAPARLFFSTPQAFKPGEYISVNVPGFADWFRFTIEYGEGTVWQAREATTQVGTGYGWNRSDPSSSRVRGTSKFVPNAKHYLYVSNLDDSGNPDWYTYVDTVDPEKGRHPYTGDVWSGFMRKGRDGTRYSTVGLIEDVATRVDNLDGLVA